MGIRILGDTLGGWIPINLLGVMARGLFVMHLHSVIIALVSGTSQAQCQRFCPWFPLKPLRRGGGVA